MNNILYEMTIEDELVNGVFAISLVDKPAIESDYVLLSKEKSHIEIKLEKVVDNKRKIVSGIVLIPDKIIPRQGYDIVFSADTIRKISENFLINGNQNNITLQHKVSVNKVKLVESWIVDDPENDKSKSLGFENVVKGSWLVSYKVEDDNLWSEYIESGVLKGFSLEGSFSEKEVHMHSESCYCHLSEEDLEEYTSDYLEEDKEIYDIIKLAKPNRAKARTQSDTPDYFKDELDLLFVWKTHPSEMGECPVCMRNANRVFKLSQWARIGIPRVSNNTHLGNDTELSTNYTKSPGPYATYCETNCNCTLERIPEAAQPSKKSSSWKIKNPFVNPFKVFFPKTKTNPSYDPQKPVSIKNQPFLNV